MMRKLATLLFAGAMAVPFFGLTVSPREIGVAPANADAVCGNNGYSCGTSVATAICCGNNQACCMGNYGNAYCGNPGC